jgi:hypothetical protein
LEKEYNKTIEHYNTIIPTTVARKDKIDMRPFYELKEKSDYNIYTIDWKPMHAVITEKRPEKNDIIICGLIKPANPIIFKN